MESAPGPPYRRWRSRPAHEFAQSIVEGRPPAVDVTTAANGTAVGICAHESALCGGERIEIPDFAG